MSSEFIELEDKQTLEVNVPCFRNLDQSWTNVSDRRYYWLVNDTQYYRPVCFENVNSFQTAFLFFVETETTVGYGKRTITGQLIDFKYSLKHVSCNEPVL